MNLPTELYAAAQVRELDRRAMQDHGLGDGELMRRAGAAAFDVLRLQWPRARRLLVVCGPGNNGGDGYVLARLARARGVAVDVVALADPAGLRGDAQQAWRGFVDAGGGVRAWDPDLAAGADVIVDAVFGTGLKRAPDGAAKALLAAMTASGRPVLAIDVPSGIDADSGAAPGVAVKARATVSFIGLKPGLLLGQGREHAGRVYFDDLGVPAAVYAGLDPVARRLDPATRPGLLPVRPRHAHKGLAGHVVVVGGNTGMPGAARMAGEAAYRSGAGLVSVATRAAHAPLLSIACPELMAHPVEDAAGLRVLLKRARALVIGPGLGQDRWAEVVLAAALDAGLPTVVDADALNLLAIEPQQQDSWVLTPHPGEAARLLRTDVRAITDDPLEAAQAIARAYGGVCVLKGAGTSLAQAEGARWLCAHGNPAMASGGMGDVLSGVIGALLAQGLTVLDAASVGVCAHAAAGDAAAAQTGDRGLLATDLLAWLPSRLAEWEA